jgi:hypothetical protein
MSKHNRYFRQKKFKRIYLDYFYLQEKKRIIFLPFEKIPANLAKLPTANGQ